MGEYCSDLLSMTCAEDVNFIVEITKKTQKM